MAPSEIEEDRGVTIRALMMGPSRVGKTTLLTAVLHEANAFLKGTSVQVKAANGITQRRLQSNNNDLRGELYSGEFDPGSLQGTQEVSRYRIMVDSGVDDVRMEMEFLDFPGGYLSDPSHDFLEWGVVREFLESATAMIVPIDATVLMEATLPDHRRQIPRLLALEEVAGVAREWAKCRQERAGEEPALLVLAPVKCESYFADNGGLHDRSALLFETVSRAYEPIISAVRDEVHDVLVVYAPVDSVGCVEVESARWETDAQSGRVEVHVTYLVRRPPTRRVVGAEPILTNLVKQVLDARQRVAEDERRIADEKLRAPRGFLKRVWDQVSREQARKKRALREADEASARVRARIHEFEKALERLAERSQGRRQRVL